jgi:uncharacterized protein (TIGR02453 family)
VATATAGFTGFRPEAIQFFVDLREHNDRAWFQPRKDDFEALIKEPFEALVAELADRFERRGIPLLADPKHSIFRIYRDTRFSKDKSPYKRHLGASFPWVEGRGPDADAAERAHGNGAYFNFEPGAMYVGGGMWMPDKARLDAFRQRLIDDPGGVRAALEEPGFVARFGSIVAHEELKRVPPGFPADHPMADLARHKDLVFGHPLSDADVGSPDLPDLLAGDYAAATPVFRFLSSLSA